MTLCYKVDFLFKSTLFLSPVHAYKGLQGIIVTYTSVFVAIVKILVFNLCFLPTRYGLKQQPALKVKYGTLLQLKMECGCLFVWILFYVCSILRLDNLYKNWN